VAFPVESSFPTDLAPASTAIMYWRWERVTMDFFKSSKIRRMIIQRKVDALNASAENQMLSCFGADLCRRCDRNLKFIEHDVGSYCNPCWAQVIEKVNEVT